MLAEKIPIIDIVQSLLSFLKLFLCDFYRSLLVYCKTDQTCHHYDSMNQGNIAAAKRIWNFLRIFSKGDFLMDLMFGLCNN